MSGNRETTLRTRSRCHGSEDFRATEWQLFLSYYNRLIKFFSQGAPVCVGKTKVCCCSHTGQYDNEVWGKTQQKITIFRCMQGVSRPLAKEGYSTDCDLGAFRVPHRDDPLVALVVSVPVWLHLLPGAEPLEIFLA